ncbi:MAG: Smr/MutS family protein [Bacteroidales bacterium]|nr:Smr/MutS family protein [Bacteroidales bacterium]
MIYPHNFEQKIDFDQIRGLINQYCISTLGKSKVDEIVFLDDFEKITRLHEEGEEFRHILLMETSFPAQNYFDLRKELHHLQIEGTCIEIQTLCELKAVLQTIQDCLVFFRVRAQEGKYPFLNALAAAISVDNTLIQYIAALVDEKSNIRDNASADLQTIRQKIHAIERDIQKNLRKIMHQAKQDNLIESAAEFTVREGRLVIPVPAANKRRLKGFIHDESSTGQTVFIEPQEIFESNNTLRDLQLLEKREILRILLAFTNTLRPSIPSILEAFNFLSTIDFIRAKAKFALSIDAVKPLIVNKSIIQWQKAKHPLLYLNFKKQNKEVVPITIEMGVNHRILLLSGPNAGGKSVCLKTLGLLQYMFQCGLAVPVSELSEFGIFKHVFIDIGDEQSIENDLSTYSSHLKNMDAIVQGADAETLFLIDELGGGTDPQYGGAIAESLLETLSKYKSIGLATTHFGNLKAMAARTEGIENAAMLFDEEAMKPLFVLKMGKWGSSFTFEIARKIGFSESILEKAIAKIGTAQIDYEFLLHKLEREKIEIDSQKRMMEAVDTQLKLLIEKHQSANDELKNQKYEILKNAKQEAKAIVDNANKIIEKAVRDIKETKADKEVVKEIKSEIKAFTGNLEKIVPPPPSITIKKQLPTTIKIQLHDFVIISDTNTVGEVTSIKDDEIIVTFNSINFKTTLDKVSKTSNSPKQVKSMQSHTARAGIYEEISEKFMHFTSQLDLRGKRVDEALSELERYIDDAVLLHIGEVKILHGKGNGVLRKITREMLSRNQHIADFYDEKLEWGGYGITVVKLR